ncbi:MAG: tetratricopeptide repeat protein, partial [Myxococcota bacterium]
RGRIQEAQSDCERALKRLRGQSQPPREAAALAKLGNIAQLFGESETALQRHHEALTIRQEALGPKSVDVADSHYHIARLHNAAGRPDVAREHLDQATSIALDVYGPDHPRMVAFHLMWTHLALDEADLKRAETSLSEAQRVVGIADETSIDAGLVLDALGQLRRKQLDDAAAVSAFEASVAMLSDQHARGDMLGAVRHNLAQAYWAVGRRGEARDTLSAARVELRDGGKAAEADLRELEETQRGWGRGE